MTQSIETQVLVVGAGPVGLLTALTFARKGVDVQVVDEDFRTAAHSYALALHPHSLRLLDELGLAEEIVAHGLRVESVAFYHGSDRVGELKLSGLSGKFPFALSLPQSALESALEQQLKQAGVKVLWNHAVRALHAEAGQVTAVVDRLTRGSCGYAVATTEWITDKTLPARAQYVVGADGYRSVVRRVLGAEYEPAGATECYAVFEFHSDVDPAGEVRIVFEHERTNVLWPLPGGRLRWSFQREDGRMPERTRTKRRLTVPIGRQVFPHVPPEELIELIRTRAPWFTSGIRSFDWSIEVRFDRRLADCFGRERMWLAGDAAHLTGPVGGQSLNLGLREAADLAGRLTRIIKEGAAPSTLADYHDLYHREWRQLLALEGGLVAGAGAEAWAREHCAQLLPSIPATGEELADLARQVGLDLA